MYHKNEIQKRYPCLIMSEFVGKEEKLCLRNYKNKRHNTKNDVQPLRPSFHFQFGFFFKDVLFTFHFTSNIVFDNFCSLIIFNSSDTTIENLKKKCEK